MLSNRDIIADVVRKKAQAEKAWVNTFKLLRRFLLLTMKIVIAIMQPKTLETPIMLIIQITFSSPPHL